jgi:hypothetical protein
MAGFPRLDHIASWQSRRNQHAVPLIQRKNMPLTKLDANAALVVIDLQKGIIALPTVASRR